MFGNLFAEEDAAGGPAGCAPPPPPPPPPAASGSPEQQQQPAGGGPPPPGRPSSGLCGIENQGATCYLNSLLQTLLLTPEFREALFRLSPKELGRIEDKDIPTAKVRVIPLQIQRLFARLLLADLKAVSTVELTDSFGWSNNEELEHQDVQELNRILFAAMENSLIGTSGKDLIAQLYHGIAVNQITCTQCGRISEREESFLDLNVAVKGNQSLEDSLRSNYVDTETMSGNNQYQCEGCKQLVDAKKGAKLRSLPPILTVSLMRFNYDLVRFERYKETCKFTFPHELNMAPYCDCPDPGDTLYELFSVIIHQGSTHGGHYHAYIKDIDQVGHWTPPEEEPVIIPVDYNGRVEFMNCETPIELLAAILVQQPDHSLQLDQLLAQLLRWTGSTWNRRFKRHWGPIGKFISTHPEIFHLCSVTNMVTLMEEAVKSVLKQLSAVVATSAVSGGEDHCPNSSPSPSPVCISSAAQQDAKKPPVRTTRSSQKASTSQAKVNHTAKMNGEIKVHAAPLNCFSTMNGNSTSHGVEHWFDFNDANISCICPEDISRQFSGKECAYMLFYRLKSLSRNMEAFGNIKFGVSDHLLAMVDEGNQHLKEKREQYELAINQISVRLLHTDNYHIGQSALHPFPEGNAGLDLMIDQRITVQQFKELVSEHWNSLCPTPLCINVCKETACGLHLYQDLDDAEKSLKELGITSGTVLFLWNGTKISGEIYLAGEAHEPVLLHVKVVHSNGSESDAKSGFRKSTSFSSLRHNLAHFSGIPIDQMVVSYVEPKEEDGSCSVLDGGKDMQTLNQLAFSDGGKLFVEKKVKGRNGVSSAVLRHAQLVTLHVENRTGVYGGGERMGGSGDECQIVSVNIHKDETVSSLKEEVLSQFNLVPGNFRLRIEQEDGGFEPPLCEYLRLDEAKLTSASRIILEHGQPVNVNEIWITFSVPSSSGENVCQHELVVNKTSIVDASIKKMVEIAGLGAGAFGWHLARTKINGEPWNILDDKMANLEQEAVSHGDHLLLKEGNLLPRGYVKLRFLLFPTLPTQWPTVEEQCEDMPKSLNMWMSPDESHPVEIGEVDICQETTMDFLRKAALTHVSQLDVPDSQFLRLRVVDMGSEPMTNGTSSNGLSHNCHHPQLPAIPRMGRVLRGHTQTVRNQKLTSGTSIGVQVLPYLEDLSAQQLVLQVVCCKPDTKEYGAPIEVIWDASPPSAASLNQAIASHLQLPLEHILLAKYFPNRYEWMVIRDAGQNDGKVGGKKHGNSGKSNLRNAPFLVKDGDTVGVKDLRLNWNDVDDFNTAEDVEAKRRLKDSADEKRKRRREKNNDTGETEDQQDRSGGARRQRTEEGIHIKVADFS